MGKKNMEPELDMFTALNPEHGMANSESRGEQTHHAHSETGVQEENENRE